MVVICCSDICCNYMSNTAINNTVKPLINDTLKEDKPPNVATKDKPKVLLYTHSIEIISERGQPLYKAAGPKGVLIKRLHCSLT